MNPYGRHVRVGGPAHRQRHRASARHTCGSLGHRAAIAEAYPAVVMYDATKESPEQTMVAAWQTPNAPPPPSLGVFARRASRMLVWWMRGLARPTPFFDERTKAPRAAP